LQSARAFETSVRASVCFDSFQYRYSNNTTVACSFTCFNPNPNS
jgi:hypothetical protein